MGKNNNIGAGACIIEKKIAYGLFEVSQGTFLL